MPEYIISIHAIMTILLCIRLVSRFQRYGGRPGLDDVFITLAWIVSTANAITTLLGKVQPLGSVGHMPTQRTF
jgi:hypothetical protein